MMAVVSITKQDAESLIDGAAVALQWGEVSNACVRVRERACANVLYCVQLTLHFCICSSSQGLGPIVTPSEAESNSVGATWTFKMTSKVGFSSSHAHLPTGV
jgi:hypothetical protein